MQGKAKVRDQWGTRIGFILAAVGSAIGLGNIWRFPYMAYENGGGAFLIPYFVALLTAGIPFLILEFGAGHRFKGSAPSTFSRISKGWQFLGWWQVLVAFVITVYYVVVIGWAVSYFKFAFTQSWGTDTKAFFFSDYLQLSDSALSIGGLRPEIAIAVVASWLVTWLVLFSGVKKGIELANKIFMPLLFLMVVVITVRALTLPGALQGLDYLFSPDFSKLGDYKVWVAAYGQIFFTLSIGFAIMITYSSYLPEKADINNNAFMTAFINCGFSMLAGIMVFAVLGFMASQQGVGVDKVVTSGVGLAFITIPKAINYLPAPGVFGPLFFLALIFAGVSSMISICEACVAAVIEKWGLDRKIGVTVFCMVGGILSLIFTTNGGLYILDITDHFINNYGILMAAWIELVFLCWFVDLDVLKKHVNEVSDFTVGAWWTICLKFITPVILGYIVVAKLIGDVLKPYEGYPVSALVYYGWLVILAVVIIAVIAGFGEMKSEKKELA